LNAAHVVRSKEYTEGAKQAVRDFVAEMGYSKEQIKRLGSSLALKSRSIYKLKKENL
jgi:hypothetical protein